MQVITTHTYIIVQELMNLQFCMEIRFLPGKISSLVITLSLNQELEYVIAERISARQYKSGSILGIYVCMYVRTYVRT